MDDGLDAVRRRAFLNLNGGVVRRAQTTPPWWEGQAGWAAVRPVGARRAMGAISGRPAISTS